MFHQKLIKKHLTIQKLINNHLKNLSKKLMKKLIKKLFNQEIKKLIKIFLINNVKVINN